MNNLTENLINNLNNKSPVCCVLGHVNVGKTQLLDKLRTSAICSKEVGDLTQQIGSTYFTSKVLSELAGNITNLLEINGLLMIDTPGHDCFSQMRMIGAEVSHLAIIVVDILKGLEEQTFQCIEILKSKNIQFIIVMNKMDRIYGWKKTKVNTNGVSTLKKSFDKQNKQVLDLLKDYSNKIICQLAKIDENACLYYENKNIDEYISLIPISAVTGEGISDLIVLISKMTTRIFKKEINNPDTLYKYNHGYIIDIKQDDKHGTVCYAINMSNELSRNDKILIEGSDTIYETEIKDIFVPDNETEMKNKNGLNPISSINGTMGIALKLKQQQIPIEKNIILGGIFLKYDAETHDTVFNILKNRIKTNNEFNYTFDKIGITIVVNARSMASAIIETLKNTESFKINKIKVSNIHIGNIDKALIIKAGLNTNDEDSLDFLYAKRYSIILDYNINYTDEGPKYDEELIKLAKMSDVTIIHGNIIYKLFDKYASYIEKLNDKIKSKYPRLIKPFQLQILPQFIFLKSPPLFGIKVVSGSIKINNYIEAYNDNEVVVLGKLISIQKNNKIIEEAKTGDDVCIKIDTEGSNIEYGKQFDVSYTLRNYITVDDKHIREKYSDIFS